MRTAVLLVVLGLATAGCGSETGVGDATDDPTRGTRAVGGETQLTVVVRPGPGEGRRTYTLVCDPSGGDHPAPDAACRVLQQLESPFAAVPEGTACTELYGGPHTARVAGTFRGEPVDARFDRTNGCEISRWDAYVALLVERGGAEGS